ncbi:MAG: hypothetical protein IJ740_18930 [Ruminococcus sp.]|nr:hypothetical protein [Ruminococcus sp.]MBR1752917.1 hypothetical protein [Ruminococcus sp.]
MSYLSDLLGTAYKEGMSEDEISSALEKVNKKDTSDLDKLKASLTKANAEAAKYKQELRDKQTDDEKAAAAQEEQLKTLIEQNNELKKTLDLSEKKAKLISSGYDEELAASTAKAMIDGDMDTVISNQSKYLDTQKAAIKADLMKNTPRPAQGNDGAAPIDYGKKIEEAQASGNLAEAAYYTRLQAAETNKT